MAIEPAGAPLDITVVGAGIVGLWQALLLARAGHTVRVLETSQKPFHEAASQYAGAMIAPYCEAESAEPIVCDQGLEAARLWRETYPDLIENGTLVVAAPRDASELRRFARVTVGHALVESEQLARLEPDLAGRFRSALFYSGEAHLVTPDAMRGLLDLARSAGATVEFGRGWEGTIDDGSIVVDCRGMAARDDLPTLRGVRGERILVRTDEVTLSRPVRLLHPRHPLYVVPWDDGRFLIGATVIESEDTTRMTVRSALELLGLAYALHPGFGEAEILELSAGVRPAFPDNVPRAVVRAGGRHILVNGAYRHGFLLAPVLADAVRKFLGGANQPHPLIVDQRSSDARG